MHLVCENLAQLPFIAEKIIKFANETPNAPSVWRLEGNMGAGKTTSIKAMAAVWNVNDIVQSPTFSLVNEYHSPTYGIIYHFDFYRLSHEHEALDFGIEEYFDSGAICLLEWASKIPNLLPEHYWLLNIEVLSSTVRTFELTLV